METVDDMPGIKAKLRYLQATLAPASMGQPVSRIETHMSWILLGGERVLKLKKPVHYPFLDFTTVESRERNARAELRLNRRLAPRVYLGLLALQWDDGVFSLMPEEDLPAPGRTVDWLVSMQRLPAARMLDRVIARGELQQRDIDALLEVLVPFYRHAPRSAIGEDEYLQRLRDEIAASRSVLAMPRFDLPQVPGLLDRMDRAVARHEDLLRARVRGRHIVEGHGDLRPEHVCLVDAVNLGLYGFGAAAHLIAQVARHEGRRVYAFTRSGDAEAQSFARSLGAVWAGGSADRPPEPLDAAIIFAPVGALVPLALRAVRKGGRVVCGGIHMSDIPSFAYRLLWEERQLLSVANLTRADGAEFLRFAARVPLRVETTAYPLERANDALADLRTGRLQGAAVLVP